MDFKNVDQLIGQIVNSKLATLHELKAIYSLEDAYDLFEIYAISNYNKFIAMKDAREKANKKRG